MKKKKVSLGVTVLVATITGVGLYLLLKKLYGGSGTTIIPSF